MANEIVISIEQGAIEHWLEEQGAEVYSAGMGSTEYTFPGKSRAEVDALLVNAPNAISIQQFEEEEV